MEKEHMLQELQEFERRLCAARSVQDYQDLNNTWKPRCMGWDKSWDTSDEAKQFAALLYGLADRFQAFAIMYNKVAKIEDLLA